MSRKVKCQITGEVVTSDNFYKITTNGKNKYYKSEEVYEEWLKIKDLREKILDKITSLLRFYTVDKMVLKELKTLSEKCSYEVIWKAIELNEKELSYWVNSKEFNNNFGKVRYFFAILSNKVNEVTEDMLVEYVEPQTINTEYFIDENIFDTMVTFTTGSGKKRKNDISNLL